MIVIQTLQLTESFTDSDTASSRLPMRSSCIMLDFFKHQLNADSRVPTHIQTSVYLHTHTTLILYLFIKCSGYNCNHILLSFNVYVNISIFNIVIECCVWMYYFGCNIMYVFDLMSWISVPCHEGPPATKGHFRSEPEMAARGRYYCTLKLYARYKNYPRKSASTWINRNDGTWLSIVSIQK